MKQIKYFCNLCEQEIPEGAAGLGFQKMQSLMGQGISIAPVRFQDGDLQICQRCAETVQGKANETWPAPKKDEDDEEEDTWQDYDFPNDYW